MSAPSTPLGLISADWNAPANVVAFTTTRQAGASRSPYSSLNLGMHVGDEPQAVAHNRQQLRDQCELPNYPCWLEQVHGTRVVTLDDEHCEPQADGAITTKPAKVCAVMTADCMPLFLCNCAGSKVALLHVGWQGMAKNIIELGITQFSELPEEIIAWAGPTIGRQHFEIGNEVRQQLGGPDVAYLSSPKEGKCYADLYALAQQRLAALGVHAFSHANYCTYADDDKFFSYRRDGTTGRMASIIYMR